MRKHFHSSIASTEGINYATLDFWGLTSSKKVNLSVKTPWAQAAAGQVLPPSCLCQKPLYPSKNLSFLPFYAKEIAGMLLKSIRSSHNVCETFSDFSRILTVQRNISAGENGSAWAPRFFIWLIWRRSPMLSGRFRDEPLKKKKCQLLSSSYLFKHISCLHLINFREDCILWKIYYQLQLRGRPRQSAAAQHCHSRPALTTAVQDL